MTMKLLGRNRERERERWSCFSCCRRRCCCNTWEVKWASDLSLSDGFHKLIFFALLPSFFFFLLGALGLYADEKIYKNTFKYMCLNICIKQVLFFFFLIKQVLNHFVFFFFLD